MAPFLGHAGVSEELPVRVVCVTLDLAQRAVTRDRHQFMCGVSSFSEAPSAVLKASGLCRLAISAAADYLSDSSRLLRRPDRSMWRKSPVNLQQNPSRLKLDYMTVLPFATTQPETVSTEARRRSRAVDRAVSSQLRDHHLRKSVRGEP